MQDLKLTFIQADLVWKDIQANLHYFQQKIHSIGEETHVVILPEMFNTGFVVEPEGLDALASFTSLEWMVQMATKYQVALGGSMIVHENASYYNRFYWVEPGGLIKKYDKRHLFTLGGEDKHFTAGQKPIIIEYKGWKIKPLICYDLRFPVWAKNTMESGDFAYDLLIYVANWPSARNNAWKSLLVARAIENQSYVVGVNRIGLDGRKTPHTGSSAVIGPKGDALSKEVEHKESMQTVLLSAADMINYRKKFTFGLDWDQFTIA